MSKKFDKLLEKATDATLVEADWEMIMNAVDCVRSGEVPPKLALASVRKRYHIPNPHVCHHALLVLEALVKNCGDKFHKEVATKETMEEMKHLAAESSEKVKEKILELIQCWAHAFRDKPEYKIVKDTHALMKLEGFSFPAFREADAMFAAEVAPDWVDSDTCYRCKVAFSLLNRKHHCRNCGQIFCDKCSGRYIPLPHIGIEKEVRVCETCFDKVLKSFSKPAESGTATTGAKTEEKPPTRKDSSERIRSGTGKDEDATREDEELQLALAISQSEAEEKERQRQRELLHMYNGPPAGHESSGVTNGLGYKGVMDNSTTPQRDAAHDPSDNELARYLNRDYWEQRRVEQKTGILRQSPTPSAPSSDTSPMVGTGDDETGTNGSGTGADGTLENGENGEVKNGNPSDLNFATFAQNLRSTVDVFVNRIRTDQMRGRSVLGDGNVQTMFMTLTNMHSQLLKHLNELDDRRGYFESLQDKLAQIQDAREAIEALRDEHEQHRRAEMLELQRQRQVQMFAKLGVMRQKKNEMLEQQRLVALQRMEDERRQMEMRKQMQLQQQAAMMARYNAPGAPAVLPGQQPPAGPYYASGQQQPQAMYYGPGGVPVPGPYDMSQMAANLPTSAPQQPPAQPQPQQHPASVPQQQQYPGYGTHGQYHQAYGHPHQQPQFHQPATTTPIPSTYQAPQAGSVQQPQQPGAYYQPPFSGQQPAPTQVVPAQAQAPPPAAPYYPGSPAHGAPIPQQPPTSHVYPGSAPGYPPQGVPMPQYAMAPTAVVPYDGQHGQVPPGVYHPQQQHVLHQQPQQQHIPEAQLINFD